MQGLQIWHVALNTMSSSIASAAKNVAGEDYIYPSKSDNSDFEDSFRTILDDTSEVFDPLPAVPSDLESESENIKLNENDENGDEPNSYGLQETPIYNYFGDAEDEEDFQDGWYWTYLPNEQDTGPEMGPFLGKQQNFHLKYRPGRFLSVDEGSCGFRGKVKAE